MDPTENKNPASTPASTPELKTGFRSRQCAAGGVGLGVAIYLVLVVCGAIKHEDRLTGVEIGLLATAGLAIAILLTPKFTERISKFKFRDFEIELERMQKDQKQQKEELDGVRFVLTMLLKSEELDNLRNLQTGKVNDYLGSAAVRAELGKLLDLRLIEKLPDQHIRYLRDGVHVNLSNFVRLTPRGEDFLRRLPESKPS